MKTNLLVVALMFAATIAFSQTKDSKSDEKPLRKIASGNGARQINEDVEREVSKAMKDLDIQLKDIDVDVNLSVLRSLEGLDEQIERSLEGLDETIERSVEASLEGLDVQINESVEESLRVLEHLDIDFNFDGDEFDRDRSIEEFRREALRDDTQKPAPKKDPKKKD